MRYVIPPCQQETWRSGSTPSPRPLCGSLRSDISSQQWDLLALGACSSRMGKMLPSPHGAVINAMGCVAARQAVKSDTAVLIGFVGELCPDRPRDDQLVVCQLNPPIAAGRILHSEHPALRARCSGGLSAMAAAHQTVILPQRRFTQPQGQQRCPLIHPAAHAVGRARPLFVVSGFVARQHLLVDHLVPASQQQHQHPQHPHAAALQCRLTQG